MMVVVVTGVLEEALLLGKRFGIRHIALGKSDALLPRHAALRKRSHIVRYFSTNFHAYSIYYIFYLVVKPLLLYVAPRGLLLLTPPLPFPSLPPPPSLHLEDAVHDLPPPHHVDHGAQAEPHARGEHQLAVQHILARMYLREGSMLK